MRLQSFRVRTFRNIIDSTDVCLEDVTCLVGKNEAGKSAVLEALHALNPANSGSELDLLEEYPRWLKKEHEISGEIDTAVPITAVFELSEDELGDFEDRFGVQVLRTAQFKASRSYAAPATIAIETEIDCEAFMAHFVAELPDILQSALQEADPGTSSELIATLNELAAQQDSEGSETNDLHAHATAALVRLWEITGAKDRTLREAVETSLRENLPRTFYFSTYSQLRGRYNLTDVLNALAASDSGDASVAAAADFLRLARITPATVKADNFEASNAELEAVSSLLTKRVKQFWKQNDHLKLRVRLEAKSSTNAQGQPIILRWLQFRVEDERHDFTNRLDRRSTGFQWFVSFLAAFLEFEKDANLVLLLDEPGLSLHARAQRDLLDAIEQKLASSRQVLYSTHSPFMVRPNKINQARVVENRGPDAGTSVSNDAGVVSDPDTLFPLEAALGYDIAETLFVGRRNIIVEGISDFIYLNAISGHLAQQGVAGLPVDARVIPAGGASNIPTFLALLGTQLDAVVLTDGNTSDQRIQTAIDRGRLKQTRIVTLDNYATVKGADIEDLFTPQEYLDLYNAAFATTRTLADLPGTDRIVKRIARYEGNDFDHGLVAAYFLRTLEHSLSMLSDETLKRFESVMADLTAALPPSS